MPKKKTKTATRAKPVLPDGDEGKYLSHQEKLNKLDAYLKDLENKEVEMKFKFDKMVNSVMNHVEACYTQEIKRLPVSIRQMKLCDFMGGTVDAVLANPDLCEADDDFDSLTELRYVSTVKKTCAKSRLNSTRTYDTILEDGVDENGMLRSSKKKSTVKKPRKGKNSSILSNISNAMPPPSAPSSVYRNGYYTPVNKGLAAAGWETPLITPKFDPRLPVTPAQMRDARPGEVYMSLGGSPIRDPRTTMQNVLRDKEQELIKQFDSPDKIRQILSAFSNIIAKSKETVE